MLFLKKLSYYFIIPPGIFIIGFLLAAFWSKGWRRYLMIGFATVLYLFSISPVKDLFIYPLEKDYRTVSCDGDLIVILGGGVYGNGELMEDAFKRVVKGFQLGKEGNKKIIVSGGRVSEDMPYEAEVMKGKLVELGVNEKDIFVDRESKDTVENAKFTKRIIESSRLNDSVILITSAYHMTRSVLLFEKAGIKEICPVATDFKYDGIYSIFDFLPSASNINTIAKSLKEYIGLVFYSLK